MILNQPFDLHPSGFRSLFLFLFTLGNYALMYLANIVLARSLTVTDFDDYSVALSIVTMLSTLATLGLEKYALRAIALFRERQDWPKFHGFWLFSIWTIGCVSLVLFALLSIGLEASLALHHADYHIAIVLFASFLPVIAMTLFLVEVISAQGAHIIGIAIYRLFLPLIYLLLIYSFTLVNVQLTASAAVVSYGFTWTLTLLLIWSFAKALMPVAAKKAKPLVLGKKWISRSLPLVFNSLMLTVMTSSGVVILELLFPSGLEVGIYAVAAQTGGFISLIGTSTNRYYLPKMVILVEYRDTKAIQQLIKLRSLVIGSLILVLYTMIALFGQHLLDLFGEHFSGRGYLTLVIIASGASMSGLFADMPYYLQYLGFNRTVLSFTCIAMLMMLSLAFFLAPSYGTVGVAIAYMAPITLLFISFRILATLHLNKF